MTRAFRIFFQITLFIFPWRVRRWALGRAFNFTLHPSSYIGYSVVLAQEVRLNECARIGHLNFVKGLELLSLEDFASIGNLNWITAFPRSEAAKHFFSEPERFPSLVLERHCAMTNRHLIDCTNEVLIGEYSTFAGFRSQLLTHSVDIGLSRQASSPVKIGKYCFIGTGSILLPGSSIADYCVLAAGSVLTGKLTEDFCLYGGTPAKKIKDISRDSAYFHRSEGFIF